jgi:hypothetical protein
VAIITPSLTITITPPGGSPIDYSTRLMWGGGSGGMTITQNFGRQGDTATFFLMDQTTGAPDFVIPVFSQVKIVDNTAGGVTIFAGVVNNPSLILDGPTRNEWQCQCTDYAFYADNSIVQGTFIGQTVDQIVVALTQQANCGITAATIANGGFVAPGPQLPSYVSNYTTLSGAWRRLAQLAGQVTPYGWYVDENRNLHFYDATTAQNSGVTFTTSPTNSGSLTEGHLDFDNFSYEWDGQSVRNRILVQGANQAIKFGTITNPATDTWQSNGTQSSWPLRFTVTGSPVLAVNGTQVAVTPVSAGQTSTAPWQIAQNSVGAWFLIAASVPPAGQKIQLWYDYLVPVVAQANDFGSQSLYTGPNGGVFAEYISDTSLTTVPMALARAMRERTEYAFAVERMNFSTTEDWLGWIRAGQTCTIINRFVPDARTSYSPGINGTFIIIGNSVQFGAGGFRKMQLTAVRI